MVEELEFVVGEEQGWVGDEVGRGVRRRGRGRVGERMDGREGVDQGLG